MKIVWLTKTLLAAVAVTAVFAGTVAAKAPEQDAPKYKFLAAVDVAPAVLLPAPPKDSSDEQKAELAELHAIAATRTPERLARARSDDTTQDATLFAETVGPGFDLKALPMTAKVLKDARDEAGLVSRQAKLLFDRNRPYDIDPALNVCTKYQTRNPTYPSGHTTVGFAMGIVLARLLPEKAPAIMARAQEYGFSRMVCGVHYRSDVVSGQVIGSAVALALLQKTEFQLELAAAQSELRKAFPTP